MDTYNLIVLGQTAGKKQYADARMILNLSKAIDIVLLRDYELDKHFLFNLHSVVAEGEIDAHDLGCVRDVEVLIQGSHYVPAVGRDYLNEELKYLFEVFNKIENPVEKAIYAHLNLAYLQYF